MEGTGLGVLQDLASSPALAALSWTDVAEGMCHIVCYGCQGADAAQKTDPFECPWSVQMTLGS